MTKDSNRLCLAKKNNSGIQFTIDVYVPLPHGTQWIPEKAKQNLTQKLKPIIENAKKEIEALKGIVRVYQNV